MCFAICITIVKCILGLAFTIINVFSFLFGVVFLFMGLALKYGFISTFSDFLEEATEKANKLVAAVPDILHAKSKIHFHGFDKDVLVGYVSLAFICLGVFLIFTSLFGLIISCAAKAAKKMLRIFLTIIIVFLTLVVIAMLVTFRYLVYHDMKMSLKNYAGLRDMSLKGMTMNSMMIALDCCGIKGYKDFHELENWPPKNLDGNLTLPNSIGYVGKYLRDMKIFKGCSKLPIDIDTNITTLSCPWMDSTNFKTPMACCKNLAEISEGCHLNGIANETNNWMNEGCRTRADEYMSESPFLRYVFPAIIVFMILLCVISVCNMIFGGEDEASKRSSKRISETPSVKNESRKSESSETRESHRSSQRASQRSSHRSSHASSQISSRVSRVSQ